MRRYLSSPFRLVFAIMLSGFGTAVLAVFGCYQYLQPSLPDVAAIRDLRLQVPLRIYSRDGKLIAQFGEQRRIPLALEAIPQQLINAVLAAEDDRFFYHGGVDYPGLARATVKNFLSGNKGEGASTITMQLARGIFLSPQKNYRRKLLEIFLTLRIEQEFTKQEILALYLNKMFLGQRSYGVGAAAEVYFGKSMDQLTIPEMALIAGTFRLPSRDNPVASADLAKTRRVYVLRRMRENGYITPEEYEAALDAPVESKLHGPAVEVDAPYIAEMVRADIYERFGTEAYTEGYDVITSIDSRLQNAAVRAVRAGLLEYDQRHGYRGPLGKAKLAPGAREAEWNEVLDDYPVRGEALEPALVLKVDERSAVAWTRSQGRVSLQWPAVSWARTPPANPGGEVGPALQRAADVLSINDVIYVTQERGGEWRMTQVPEAQAAFVAMDPQDGALSALVGGFDYFGSNFNRAVQARRQAGSSFKPFIYSAALDRGFNPATVVNDAPLVIEDAGLESAYRPQNDSKDFRGPMRLREALYRSRNLVSIRVMNSIGPGYATQFIERFGFPSSSLPRELSLALGSGQVSPMQMAAGYSVFANGGFRITPYFVQRIISADGKVVFEAEPQFACADCRPPKPEGAGPEGTSAQPVASEIAKPGEGGGVARPAANNDQSRWGDRSYLQEKLLAPEVISAQNDFLITDMMTDVVKQGTAKRALVLNRSDIAGKTGTTDDKRDAWFCGFNANLVGTAWVGFDQERNLGPREQGGVTALPIWIYFMAEALRGTPEARLPQPPGLVNMRVSADTGLAARPGDANAIFELFMPGQLPPDPDGQLPTKGDETTPNQPNSEDPLF
jgi:penicillin-binding protein 1A